MTLWASAFVGIRAGLQGYSPGVLALLRFTIASLCILFVYLRLPPREKIKRRDAVGLLLLGAVTLGGYQVALNYGEQTVSSCIASFVISQSPIITTFIAIFFLRERLNGLGVLGMTISFLGVALILLGKNGQFNLDQGFFYVCLAALANSIYSVLQKPFLKKYHVIDVTAYLIWGSILPMLVFLPNLSHELVQASWTATFSAIYLGIFPGVIAYLGWSYVLAKMPASRAANFMYFMPVVATLLGWVWLGEMPPLLSLFGGIVALLGVWLVNESYTRSFTFLFKKQEVAS